MCEGGGNDEVARLNTRVHCYSGGTVGAYPI
jgi:hypothetical protein